MQGWYRAAVETNAGAPLIAVGAPFTTYRGPRIGTGGSWGPASVGDAAFSGIRPTDDIDQRPLRGMTRRMKIGLILLASATFMAVGCAPASAPDAAVASDAMLTTVTPLDRITPADVAAAYAADVKASLSACVAAHPEITRIDRANLSAFHAVGHTFHFDLSGAIESLLDDSGAPSITPAEVAERVQPWAERFLAPYADANGLYAPPTEGLTGFYYAEIDAREAKAHASAAAPGGQTFTALRALWREVQVAKSTLDSSWLRPVKVSGEPSLGEIRRTMRIPSDASFESWGEAAVDEFADAHEGPDGTPAFAPLATFLKSHAIQKRWLFQAYDHSGSTNVLVVLDEHDQLWGMQMGYSE